MVRSELTVFWKWEKKDFFFASEYVKNSMRVQISRKTEMYGVSKFFPPARLKSLNVHLKQKSKS